MGGRKTGQDKRTGVKNHDDLCGENIICAGKVAIQTRGEIAVFDAGKYFAGADNRRSQIEKAAEELDEDADADAGGDLPLSPLPEFYTTSKERHYTRKNQRQQGDKAHVYAGPAVGTPTKATSGGALSSPAQRQTVPRVGPLRCMPDGRDSLPSPPSIAPSGDDQHAYDEPRGPSANTTKSPSEPAPSQSKSSSTKPQPFSPSARLTSFLAKFKLSSSEGKPKRSSTQNSSATPPTSTPSPESFFSNATALPANGKLTSPRGRFLRALSSSSSLTNPLLKPIAHMHHRSSTAANSTPVSPAGSDPYSPITHSASNTPTSRKNPRSRSRSHVSHREGTSDPSLIKPNLPTTDWRHDLDNSSRHSLSTHLPLLRQKLKAYLMPEKSPRQHHAETHQNQLRSKQKEVNITNVSTGAHADQARQRRSDKASSSISVLNKPQLVATLLSEAREEDRQQRIHKENAAPTPDKARAAHTKVQLDQHKPHHNSMRSPGRPAVEPPTTKDTRRRGDWRKHTENILEDDIEVAERLLRVVKEHQSSKTYTSGYKGTSNYKQQSKGNGAKGQGHIGGEMVNGGSSSRKSRRSFVSPSSSPAAANYFSKQTSKEEFACPYDSDSSSDLFEIESLQAFSHVAGLYRPHDLPSNPLKSPLHLK